MKTSRNCSFLGGRSNYFRLLTVVFFVASAFAALIAGAETRTLPKYTKLVEYIESSGTQWINTWFSPTNKNVRIEVKYRFVSLPTGTDRKYVFGESYTIDNTNVRLQYSVGEDCFIGFGNKNVSGAAFNSYDTDTTHTIVCSNGVFSLDGQTLAEADLSDASLSTTDTNHPVYLFGLNVGGAANYLSSIRLYSCKIWSQGKLVRDFIPVSLTNGTTVCLYNAVRGDFYNNAGTGSFTAGPDVTAYRNAAYIESDRTALINTGYVPTSKTEIEIQFSFTQLLEDKRYVFGVYSDNGGRFMFSYGPASTGCFLGYGNTYTNSVAGIPYNTAKHIMKYVRNKGFEFDGTVVDAGSVNLTKWDGTSKSLYLGALNPNGGSANVAYLPPIRIYYCKLWEDGALVRDWVPVQRKFDGKIGLYDKVTGNLDGYYGDRADFTAGNPPRGLAVFVR